MRTTPGPVWRRQRRNGKRLGRPMTVGCNAAEVQMQRASIAKAEIARRLASRPLEPYFTHTYRTLTPYHRTRSPGTLCNTSRILLGAITASHAISHHPRL